MFSRLRLGVVVLAGVMVSVALARPAVAQSIGSLSGTVKDEAGNPLEGATVTVENPQAAPSKKSDQTNDKGEFMIGALPSGQWSVTIEADGFLPAQAQTRVAGMSGGRGRPLSVTLVAGVSAPAGMEGVGTEEIKAELDAANALFDQQDFAGALVAYQALSETFPELTAIRMQMANAHRQLKDYDAAIAEYEAVLVQEPTNQRAKIERALMYLVKGDLEAADTALTEMAQAGTATAEILYNLGEVKFAKGAADEAATWYDKATLKNPAWGKPWFKLALVALNKADNAGASAHLAKVIEVDPNSMEAGQAKLILEQLQQQ